MLLFIAAGTSELPLVEEYTNYFPPEINVCSHYPIILSFVPIFIAKTKWRPLFLFCVRTEEYLAEA